MPTPQRAIAVIFAGGEGKRLWPLSTSQNPKQLNAAFSRESMLVDTYQRALKVFPKEDIVIVATERLEPTIRQLLDIDDKHLLIQPKNADTAAAMSLTALYLETAFPESIAVTLYSDHVITQATKFRQALERALEHAAEHDRIIAIGTVPTFANSEFGYINIRDRFSVDQVYKVEGFVEKPDTETAEKLVASKQWLWNTGIKVWKVSVLLEALKQANPHIYQGLLNLRRYIGGPDYERELSAWFESIEPQSFEDSVTRRLPELYVYVADYTWEDIGNWQSIYRLALKDRHGNAVQMLDSSPKNVRFLDSSGCLVVTDKAQVTLLGVHDLVIIHDEDSLFICSRETAHHVKALADELSPSLGEQS